MIILTKPYDSLRIVNLRMFAIRIVFNHYRVLNTKAFAHHSILL